MKLAPFLLAALLCAAAISPLFARPDLPNPFTIPEVKGNPLALLTMLNAQKSAYLLSPKWRGLFLERLATQNSFVGNDAKAIADFDARDEAQPSSSDAETDALLHNYFPKDARREIDRLASSHPVIFINEAHHIPRHRAFTRSLLRLLYARGFRYFAAETLDIRDVNLNARGFPTLETGYYTQEPNSGDLVREAQRIGYKIVPYESVGEKTPDERERMEAQNLYDRILKRDSSAKLLVHAGYAHIFKQKIDTFKPMGAYFWEITKIEPLTIDQVEMTEHSDRAHERPEYKAAVRKGWLTIQPIVLENQSNNFYVSPTARGGYDVMIFHPPTHLENGRPTWQKMQGERQPYLLSEELRPPPGKSYLAQAFYKNEFGKNAVPIDQIELRPTGEFPALLLPRFGVFVIRVIDKTGRTLRQTEVFT